MLRPVSAARNPDNSRRERPAARIETFLLAEISAKANGRRFPGLEQTQPPAWRRDGSAGTGYRRPGSPGPLCVRGGLELHHQFSRDATAVFDLDALALGPLTYLGGVRTAVRALARAAATGPPNGAVELTASPDVPLQCI